MINEHQTNTVTIDCYSYSPLSRPLESCNVASQLIIVWSRLPPLKPASLAFRHSRVHTNRLNRTQEPHNLHSSFKEIADILVSFRDQVEGFSDDLLLRVFILQDELGNRLLNREKTVNNATSVCLIASSEPFHRY